MSGIVFEGVQTTAAKSILSGSPAYTVEFKQSSAGNLTASGVSTQTLELLETANSAVIFTTASNITFALTQSTDGERLWELQEDAGNESWTLLESQGSGSWSLDDTAGSGSWTPEGLSPGSTWQDEPESASENWDVVTRN